MSGTTKRGSTSPITITIPGIDLTGAEWIIVSIRKTGRATALELDLDRLSVTYSEGASVIAFELTQAESLSLRGSAEIDVNWMLDGNRDGIIPLSVSLIDTLLDREV